MDDSVLSTVGGGGEEARVWDESLVLVIGENGESGL